MINSEKDINTIADELISLYKDNPIISEEIFQAYQYGVNRMKIRVNGYLKNKAVLSGCEIIEMLESLSDSINSMSDDRIADAYNKGIETAQDIVYKYVR